MFMDSKLRFLDDAAVHANRGNTLVGDVIDLGEGKKSLREVANGQPVYLNVIVTQSNKTAASTLKLALRAADNEALTSNPDVLFESDTLANTELQVGDYYVFTIPVTNRATRRYLGLWRTIDGANMAAGLKVTAFLSCEQYGWEARQDWRNHG